MRIFWVAFFLYPLTAYSACLQIRGGFFLPAATIIQKVYNNGGMEPEIQASIPVYKKFDCWMNFNAFWKMGSSLGAQNLTSIQIYPLSVGLKYHISLIEPLKLYIGLGPSFSCVKIHDRSPYVEQHIFKTSWGVVGKSGCIYQFSPRFFCDLFVDYYYGKITPVSSSKVDSESLNVGGLRIGLGLGTLF